MNKQERGEAGEKLARSALKRKGYRIIEQNYRCLYGEIDIIARHKDSLVFIEVRSKTGASFGSPEESITGSKKQRLVSTALDYLNAHGNPDENWRFDFVAVRFEAGPGNHADVEILQNVIN
ncbi:MAG: YraN family protein [Dehalococcoidia bacterium]|jgi:putative endonuclease